MEEYQKELIQVYKTLHTNELVNSLLALGIFIGVILVVRRIYRAYKDYQGEKDYKVLFDICKQYVLIILFICVFPVALNQIELILAGVQEDVSKHFNSSVERTTGEQFAKEVTDYVHAQQASASDNLLDAINPAEYFNKMQRAVGVALNGFLLQINKYLYFFFCAGRYLWLLMLEIVAPIAIVCILDDETKQYFQTWLKNMFICYLLVPFFLLADVFGEMTIKLLSADSLIFSYSQYSLLALLGMLVLKISLYKVAANRAFKLIE